jgi:hypothetical protein
MNFRCSSRCTGHKKARIVPNALLLMRPYVSRAIFYSVRTYKDNLNLQNLSTPIHKSISYIFQGMF